ncbi:hypothetical protein [Flagellimonas sp. S3867]|uniref:hypothetical protein n=1 Tax=Flagellimonas sp. S3867 TaxID=2768063 RepID=UPI0016855E8E|nr:hypothetical protein [Flagellimonas sp. S3867]
MRISNFSFKLLVLPFVLALSTSFGPVLDIKQSRLEVAEQTLSFNTDGLFNAEFFDYVFRGEFQNVALKREDTHFLMIFEQYLRTFGRQCPSSLPTNKVEIMNWVCATEEVTTNGYGIETSRVCIEWKTVGSGLFARRDLYEAKLNVERIQSADVLRNTLAMMADPNAMGNSVDMIHKANGLKNDMAQLFNLNTCNNPGVKRFEENLKRFALNQAPIKMKGTSKYTAMKKSGGPVGAQNLSKLTNDLIANHAQTWAFNRYVPGSIAGLTVHSTDDQGRPRELQANYNYKGFSGSSAGWVRISFTNGLPKCIYFFDFPNNCKTPNSSIVASFAQGEYSK